MRILYLKQVSYKELCTMWDMKNLIPIMFNEHICYIRARKDGTINWDKAPVYKPSELKERLIFIHK